MVTALIIAGGVGERTGNNVPKQFLNVRDKPVVIYTLEAFQRHPEVEAVAVVCLDGWQEFLRTYCLQFGISKLAGIIPGGVNGQDSICRGLAEISGRCADSDLVIVHEANRPLVSAEVISDSIRVCREFGGAVAAVACDDAMFLATDENVASAYVPRETLDMEIFKAILETGG
jgi:2-C-methyl-D-erythritol 4-phosphate cytidylyltransferase